MKTNTEPLFQPVEWVPPADQGDTGKYVMLTNIRDLASGAALAMQMVERAEIQIELGDTPIIDGSMAVKFTRMSIAAMHVIEGYIDDHFDDLNDQAIDRHKAASRGGFE